MSLLILILAVVLVLYLLGGFPGRGVYTYGFSNIVGLLVVVVLIVFLAHLVGAW